MIHRFGGLWLVDIGAQVEAGQLLAEIDTRASDLPHPEYWDQRFDMAYDFGTYHSFVEVLANGHLIDPLQLLITPLTR